MINNVLLGQAWYAYKDDPESWLEDAWIRGEQACLAGRIVLTAGAEPVGRGLRTDMGRTVNYRGVNRDVPELACELTGATFSEGRWLFHWARTIVEQADAVLALLAQQAIPDRAYWSMPDTDDRYATAFGQVVIARRLRTVFYLDAGTWRRVTALSEEDATYLAQALARDAKAARLNNRPTYTAGSATV